MPMNTPRASYGRLKDSQFDNLSQSPALFLAYCCIGKCLRSQHLLLRGYPGIVVLITSSATDVATCATAAEYFFLGQPEECLHGNDRPRVHRIEGSARFRDRKARELAELYAKHPTIIVVAESRALLPEQLIITADALMDVPKPEVRHVQAARKLLGRKPLAEDLAAALARQDGSVLTALLSRPDLTQAHATRLAASGHAAVTDGPTLAELPGYRGLKPWAFAFAKDLDRWRKGMLTWSELDRGILLSGAPGTGKTIFARALAKTCGLPLIAASVSQWQAAGHLGNMLAAMRHTFEKARNEPAALVFLDELDSIGDRTKFSSDHVNYSTQVVNSLLECIDGSQGRDGVFLVAATNYPEAIDPALLRSGRIERHVRLELPDQVERAEILLYHLRADMLIEEIEDVTGDLAGWSGADLERLARAAKQSARTAGRSVRLEDVVRMLPPLETLSRDESQRVAIHECGHVIVALDLDETENVCISIRKRFRRSSLEPHIHGVTLYSKNESELLTRAALLDQICRLLGGAAAEEIALGGRSTGAGGMHGSDLHKATTLAAQMVCSYGMGDRLSFQNEASEIGIDFNRTALWRAWPEIDGILHEQFERAKQILLGRRKALAALSSALAERESLQHEDVVTIMTANPDEITR
ncbi:AAA family ATPase [Ensifer sp. ENS12]|uniref:AAA family ATPase n=1 Tax=Ensifer sp. ENS12 TaxID=2854774 RepID=UPI001C46F61B|nr:AAA family ATPase [Ensifer sp. ENS12]MBV7522119.1 AAA family ATPase [Ensifer sp. ENS12]